MWGSIVEQLRLSEAESLPWNINISCFHSSSDPISGGKCTTLSSFDTTTVL
jgi:hypothetical protein